MRPIEMRVRAQQDAIAKGDIDVGLMTLTQKDQTSDTYYPLKQEELVLIIPKRASAGSKSCTFRRTTDNPGPDRAAL
ncbi:MAG: hypothetical protein ACLSE4_04420 [Clostridium sp.]